MSDVVRIVVEVPSRAVLPPAPDAELRAAAEAVVGTARDDISDLFVRNRVAVGRPAFVRLARACGIDLPPHAPLPTQPWPSGPS